MNEQDLKIARRLIANPEADRMIASIEAIPDDAETVDPLWVDLVRLKPALRHARVERDEAVARLEAIAEQNRARQAAERVLAGPQFGKSRIVGDLLD